MRNKIARALMLLALAPLGSTALAQAEDPAVYAQPVTPDPVPNNGVHFAPQAATAGTANPGPILDSIKPDTECTPLSPCALPTPTLQTLPSPRQARVSHRGKSSVPS